VITRNTDKGVAMGTFTRRAAVVTAAAAFGLITFAGPALAEDTADPGKCNSGRGNLSETVPDNDCDPGNSAGRNNGGD
jgi:hypothetical protein